MDRQTVDRGHELPHGVEAPLGCPPVVVLRPARAALLEPVEWHTLAGVGRRFGPARRAEPGAQVLQLGVGNGERERLDHRAHAG